METLEIINIYTKSIKKCKKRVLDVPSESHFVDDNQINVYISTASCHIINTLRMQFCNFSLCIFANSRIQWFN